MDAFVAAQSAAILSGAKGAAAKGAATRLARADGKPPDWSDDESDFGGDGDEAEAAGAPALSATIGEDEAAGMMSILDALIPKPAAGAPERATNEEETEREAAAADRASASAI